MFAAKLLLSIFQKCDQTVKCKSLTSFPITLVLTQHKVLQNPVWVNRISVNYTSIFSRYMKISRVSMKVYDFLFSVQHFALQPPYACRNQSVYLLNNRQHYMKKTILSLSMNSYLSFEPSGRIPFGTSTYRFRFIKMVSQVTLCCPAKCTVKLKLVVK